MASDIDGFKRLARELKYITVIDGRRSLGSVKAKFNNLKRDHGIKPLETAIIVFSGLGEGVYEDLGAYVLRNHGYLVFHQAAVSTIAGLTPNVPDLEMFHGFASRGYLAYELGVLATLSESIDLKTDRCVKAVVGEVKGSKADFTECLGQLKCYLESKLYDEGICIVPEAVDRVDEAKEQGVGLLTWDPEGTPHFVPPSKIWRTSGESENLKEVALSIIKAQKLLQTRCVRREA